MNSIVPAVFGRRITDRIASDEHAPWTAPAPHKLAPPSDTMPPASFGELRALCLARLDPSSVATVPFDRLAGEVEKLISEIATSQHIHLNGREQRSLAEELVDDMLGLGPLEPLLKDDSIADIMVNGPDRVFIERGGKLLLSQVRFRDAAHVANICQRIATAVGRRVDEASPMVDARLKDGSRVNIVFMPLALDGPYISIRKFSKKPIDFAKLIEYGALTRQLARKECRCAVEKVRRRLGGDAQHKKIVAREDRHRRVAVGRLNKPDLHFPIFCFGLIFKFHEMNTALILCSLHEDTKLGGIQRIELRVLE